MYSNIKFILSIMLVILFTGCAASGKTQYKTLLENKSIKVAKSNAEALKQSTPLLLTSKKECKAEITLNDKIIQYDSIKSNYDIYEINGVEGDSYNIELRTLCDCFGLNKTILYPVSFIMNSEGIVINNKPESIEQLNSDSKLPLSIIFKWKGEFTKTEKYYLIVSADNSNVGSIINDLDVVIHNPIIFTYKTITIPLKSNPTGEYIVKYENNQKISK